MPLTALLPKSLTLERRLGPSHARSQTLRCDEGVPSLDAVALGGAGEVVGVVVAPLLDEWRFSGGRRRRRRGEEERGGLVAVGDAAIGGDGGGDEGGVGGDAEGFF